MSKPSLARALAKPGRKLKPRPTQGNSGIWASPTTVAGVMAANGWDGEANRIWQSSR
jgi:hypothetical protein